MAVVGFFAFMTLIPKALARQVARFVHARPLVELRSVQDHAIDFAPPFWPCSE
jgi:hypothetical protein